LRDGALGFLAPAEDSGALARECVRLAEDPALYAQIAEKAQADARVRFGNSLHCTQIAAIYDDMLG